MQDTEDPIVSNEASTATVAEKPYNVLVLLTAALLLVSFLLPWIQVFGVQVDGVQFLAHSGAKILYLIPICAALTLVTALARARVRDVAQITGALPILALIYQLSTDEAKATFEILQIGAYLAVFSGFVLLISPLVQRPRAVK